MEPKTPYKRIGDFSQKIKDRTRILAKNVCQMNGCYLRYTQENKNFEYAHIYGLGKRAQRYDQSKNKEFLQSSDNCMFLCCNHHTEIDKNLNEEYTAEVLLKMKSDKKCKKMACCTLADFPIYIENIRLIEDLMIKDFVIEYSNKEDDCNIFDKCNIFWKYINIGISDKFIEKILPLVIDMIYYCFNTLDVSYICLLLLEIIKHFRRKNKNDICDKLLKKNREYLNLASNRFLMEYRDVPKNKKIKAILWIESHVYFSLLIIDNILDEKLKNEVYTEFNKMNEYYIDKYKLNDKIRKIYDILYSYFARKITQFKLIEILDTYEVYLIEWKYRFSKNYDELSNKSGIAGEELFKIKPLELDDEEKNDDIVDNNKNEPDNNKNEPDQNKNNTQITVQNEKSGKVNKTRSSSELLKEQKK
jgi:hypothetical protein